jgi:hypothetical protein
MALSVLPNPGPGSRLLQGGTWVSCTALAVGGRPGGDQARQARAKQSIGRHGTLAQAAACRVSHDPDPANNFWLPDGEIGRAVVKSLLTVSTLRFKLK